MVQSFFVSHKGNSINETCQNNTQQIIQCITLSNKQ